MSGQVVTTGSGVSMSRQYTVSSQGQIARQLPALSSQPTVSSSTTLRAVPASIVASGLLNSPAYIHINVAGLLFFFKFLAPRFFDFYLLFLDHYGNITVQQAQPLPPISLSSHSSSQRLNPPTPRQSSSLPNTVPSSPMQPHTPNSQCTDSLPTTSSGATPLQ